MEKVKLPHEVVEFMENIMKNINLSYYKTTDLMEYLFSREVTNEVAPLDNFVNKLGNLVKLAQAIEYGYEVEEPQFKVGDWVIWEVDGYKPDIAVILDIFNKENNQILLDDKYTCNIENIRHATPEEIAAEKKRRFWASIGREVDEYHAGDIVQRQDGCFHTVEHHKLNDTRSVWIVESGAPINVVFLTLVCPVERRLDTKG